MKKTVWTFGIISGVIMSVMMFITAPFSHQIGLDRAEVIGYATIVAASLLVFFGVRSYRDNVGSGRVSFGRALAVGSLIVLISSVFYTLSWQVVSRRFFPDFLTSYREARVAQIRASGKPPAEIEKEIVDADRMMAVYSNPFMNVLFTMLEPLPVGLVIALISAGVLSRRPKSVLLRSAA